MRVLIADDEPATRRLLEATLQRWGYTVSLASDGVAAWQALEVEGGPQLAVLDGQMPGMDGVEVCRRARTLPADRYIYIILLTARIGKEAVVQGLESGADDYLCKPVEPIELRARLRVGERSLAMHAELVAAREALRVQATYDGLTSLLNRGAILETLEREIGRSQRKGDPIGLLLADVDYFKRVNDTFGHAAGDAVLREIARRLSDGLRPYDTPGRLGGEEFLMILPGCNLEQTVRLGERLRMRLEAEPINFAKEAIPVTVSMGATVCMPDALPDSATLLQAADAAMYRAKRAGRNRIEVAPLLVSV